MLKIVQRRLSVRLRPEEAYQVQQNLQARFNSLLAGVRLEYLRRLGLDSEPRTAFGPADGSQLLAGEIFMPEAGTIYYIKYVKDEDALETGAISNHRDRDFEHFFTEVREAVLEVVPGVGSWHAQDGGGVDVEDARPVSLEVSEKELEAAHEFLTQSSKALLESLAQSESTLMNKLQMPAGDPAGLLSHLEDLDLIRKDYAVVSRETGQQIMRVASKASLEESKFFSGETVDEVISCTPFCRSLLENDQWLLLMVLGTLRTLGIGQGGESVQVCQQPNSPIQLFLGLNQQRFLLVLVNHKLTLDDSYLISAQISACRLSDVVVISTHKISTLMKHHLSGANPNASFDFIDSMDSLEEQLQHVFVEKQRTYLRELLDPLSELTPVRIHELVIRKMAPQADQVEAEETQFAPVAPSVVHQAVDALPDFQPPPMAPPSMPGPPPQAPPAAPPAYMQPAVEPLPELDLPSPEEAVPDPYDFAAPVAELTPELPPHPSDFAPHHGGDFAPHGGDFAPHGGDFATHGGDFAPPGDFEPHVPLGEMPPPLPIDDFPGRGPGPLFPPAGQQQRPSLLQQRPAQPAGQRPPGPSELSLG